MSSNYSNQKTKIFFLFFILLETFTYAQKNDYRWKLQFAIGVNDPIENDVKSAGYYSYYINFPTLNLGIQYNITENLGAKLDYGFNRSYNGIDSKEFKLNYNRINTQLVYDFSFIFGFLPENVNTVVHAGPGFSATQPLGNYSANKYTFFNAIGGLELHYKVSETLSVYGDFSYVHSFSNEDTYDFNVNGFSFKGDLLYLAFGITYSFGRGCSCSL